jgi:GntR family transcriptional regulator
MSDNSSPSSLRRDRRPLPLQVRDALRARIAAGELPPGERLPAEPALAGALGVSRGVVREALKLLEQDGLVRVRHGRGHFVAALPVLVRKPITQLESVTEMLQSLGYQPEGRVLAVREQPADPEVAAKLELAPGEPVVVLERLRLARGQPLIYSAEVFPRRLLAADPAGVDGSGSRLRVLESADGVHVASSAAQIRAVRLPAAVAHHLGVPADEPWMLMEQVSLDSSGRPLIYSHDYHRGDLFTFAVVRRRPH